MANEWRSVWGVASLTTPAHRTASCIARCKGLLVRMVPPYYPGTWIHGARPRGKHILPCPLPWRSRVLTRERIWEIDLAVAGFQIRLVELLDPDEVVFERGCEGMR